ncbi:hypothetical protein BJY00DRAFT_287823 [Aspergillus carlsbadensis]|nr:hypothetical protein BJY00DRAFT_287823 [Aspergillus carlsbadensis]
MPTIHALYAQRWTLQLFLCIDRIAFQFPVTRIARSLRLLPNSILKRRRTVGI